MGRLILKKSSLVSICQVSCVPCVSCVSYVCCVSYVFWVSCISCVACVCVCVCVCVLHSLWILCGPCVLCILRDLRVPCILCVLCVMCMACSKLIVTVTYTTPANCSEQETECQHRTGLQFVTNYNATNKSKYYKV